MKDKIGQVGRLFRNLSVQNFVRGKGVRNSIIHCLESMDEIFLCDKNTANLRDKMLVNYVLI